MVAHCRSSMAHLMGHRNTTLPGHSQHLDYRLARSKRELTVPNSQVQSSFGAAISQKVSNVDATYFKSELEPLAEHESWHSFGV